VKTKHLEVERLKVEIYPSREEMGITAAKAAIGKLKELLEIQPVVRMIFAAAPSQNEFLKNLAKADGIDWSRIIAFHMDDYLGLADDAPQRFSSYLKEHLFNLVRPGQVHYLIGPDSPLTKKVPVGTITDLVLKECDRYAGLLAEKPIDIVCMGIGENGHIAFNDPPVADFNDPKLVKLVELEEACRIQQVHDGCFATLDEVPTHALTLTVPALFNAKYLYCMVPGFTKSIAVRKTLSDPVTTACPATILRQHPHARLFLNEDSASELRLNLNERQE
jgi:glucosamine-6-phosphate deaminase